MSKIDLSADDIDLPIKRTDGETLEERLTANAYHNILPARYLRKDADGDHVETQEELFDRVGKNIALAEAVFEANRRNRSISVSPNQLKPDHPRRDELAADVFGAGTTTDSDATTELSIYNVNKFAYDTIVPELPGEVRSHVEATADEFVDAMETLDFMPNSPTLMNAGDELQQLSACFVDSPGDDIDDIHQTAKEAAQVFQSGGGMGYAFWRLRPYGDPVGSTGGIASGPITFMRTYDQMCFPPGTSVLTPDGQRTIESLQEGELVVDENGEQQPVVETMERHVEEELVEVVPERLNEPIRATGEHPFKVARDDGFEWVDAHNLTEDDLLVLGHATDDNGLSLDKHVSLSEISSGPLVFTDGGTTINREYYGADKGPRPESIDSEVPMSALATVAGWYLAEGCVVYRRGIPSEVTFTLHADERDFADEIVNALDAFDAPSRIEVGDDRNTLHVHVESASFAQFVVGLFGTGASEKRVPDFLWNSPVETQARVVEALFDGDGTTETRGDSQRVKLQLTCEDIIDWVFQIGLRCGVQFSRHSRTPEERQPTYWVSASVSTALGTPLEGLFEDVPDDIRAVDRTKQVDGCAVVAIDSIDRVPYEGPVYNAEVADTHTYVADDLVVHNCETIAQGGARRGAQMGVMRISHPDIVQFIHAKNKDVSLAETLRLNDPDDYTHTSFAEALEESRELIDEDGKVPKHLRNAVEGHLSNFNISVGITDAFMEALQNDEEYTFTNPRTDEPHVATEQTKELYDMFGLGEHVEVGEMLSIPADLLWERIVEGAHENGEPGVIYLERVNKQHSFDVEEHPDHQILATNPCVTGDTEIVLADGSRTEIQELADEGHDVRVLCRDTDSDELVVKTGREPRMTRSNADLVHVETKEGAGITCTPDHEIWTPGGYVEAGDLSAGKVIVGTSELAIPAGGPSETVTEQLTVTAVADAGTGAVYNVTVDDNHNYLAVTDSSGNSPAISIANCGEQPLEEYEACNLGHINLSTLADFDAPDWRIWMERHGEEYEGLEAAVDAFLDDAIDNEEFDRRIELGTRFLENVVTMSDFPVEKIEQKVREMRKIGLGIMGLAQLYIQLGVEYGSDEANEIGRQLMTQINHGSKRASHELATQRGSFDEWEKSKFANPTEYREWFEHQTGLDADEWAEGFQIRNHNTTTIAPTGTTSMVGNTTGGCEPIYNVAYYKNVSDDVQGDEMLVEFDDYFLRVLEDNDLDVDAVKEEAQAQMAENVFDGVEGLETVPDAIGELFVTTGDLSPKEHAGIQCACQQGVDSAISKTVNAPNDSTVDDAKDVFEYIYEHGGKGVTYYRDGTRSKQVLTTRADNTDFADMDADELVAQIEEVFDGIEGFLEREDVQAAIDESTSELLEGIEGGQVESGGVAEVDAETVPEEAVPQEAFASKQPRPDVLHGVTQRIDTGYGKLYVNINEDPEAERPFELFANIGNSGGFTASFTEALAKTISTALRSGVDPREIADELQGIRSPKVAWDKGEQIQSIPDAIGTAMRRYLDGDVDKAYPQQQTLEETADEDAGSGDEGNATLESQHETDGGSTADGGSASASASGANVDASAGGQSDDGAAMSTDGPSAGGPNTASTDSDQQALIDAGESPECPECGSMSLYYSEGCKTCESCGWSEC